MAPSIATQPQSNDGNTSGTDGGTQADDHVDVLIVGAGPAGLSAALWMSRLGIKTRFVDKRGTRVYNGQADGIQSRTLEVFDSWGFVEDILKIGNLFSDFGGWFPKPDNPNEIQRSAGNKGMFDGFSRYPSHVLHQGYIEKYMMEAAQSFSDIHVERGTLPSSLSIDKSKLDDPNAYPLTIELTRLSEKDTIPFQMKDHTLTKNEDGSSASDGMFRSNLAEDDTDKLISNGLSRPGSTETVHAKYMIGCEGAHSWTRRQLGFVMEGERTDHVWGVMDVVAITDFPDIRKACIIQSPHGSMLVIPRENGITRLYTQLAEIHPDATGFTDRSKITAELILETCRKVMKPYSLDYKYCDWYAGYQIGQRLSDHYSAHNRIFLAGDAVHTHSPKEGQGMNYSIQDTHNLGWKLAAVIHGEMRPSVLPTYELERRDAAGMLIAIDRKISAIFSGKPTTDDDLANAYLENARFIAGVAVHYPASALTVPLRDGQKDVAPGLVPGKRFPSRADMQVVCHADLCPWHLQHFMFADARWRLVVLAGDVADSTQWGRLNALGDALSAPDGLLARYTHYPRHKKQLRPMQQNPVLPLFDVLTVHRSAISDREITSFHPAFFPKLPNSGYEYEKIFVDQEIPYAFGGKFHEWLGVDAKRGCIVAVRPDQYIAWKGEFEELGALEEWLTNCLIETPRR